MNRIACLNLLAIPVALATLVPVLDAQASSIRVTELRCEYRVNPLGIDVTQPRLSWAIEAVNPAARGLRQSAYRILVAASEQALSAGTGDLWDSGKVDSDQSIQIVYDGKPLGSGSRAFWKVEVWDQTGEITGWSEPALWSMGLLRREDWKGKWIGLDSTGLYKRPGSPFHSLEKARWIWFPSGDPASGALAGDRFFRAAFTVPDAGRIRKAVCVMGADHQFELFVNGAHAGKGEEFHSPEIIEITSQVKSGRNVIAVRAANEEEGKPAGLIGAIRVDFVQGEPLFFRTGEKWKSAISAPADWEKADFDDAGWSAAKQLGALGMAPWGEAGFSEERALPARLLRKEFEATHKAKRATAYVSGLGLFELYVNGSKIGDHVLSPGLTDYDKRVQYVTFDVTNELVAGRNAIGLMLGNGRFHAPRGAAPDGTRDFGDPKALLQLDIEYDDGSTAETVTDDTWKLTTAGPIRGNNEYDGEEYDARMELSGWSRTGFDDSGWQRPQLVSAPAGEIVAQMAEPLRVVENVRPVSVKKLRPGVYLFDMGQNMVGWCRLNVSGAKGTQVTLRHAETLRDNGELYVENLRSAQATDLYTLRGGGPETWEPRFTYHGFRYVEMTGYPGEPPLSALEGRVVQDAMTQVADFTTSDPLLNHLHKNIFWGVRSNYRSIPTDCPQRDERQGWLGDRSTVSRSESYLFDVAAFYNKWMNDLEDSQHPDGSIPDVSPAYWVIYNDDVTWPSTFLLVPGMLYDQYGDLRVLERHYPAFKKWIEHMRGFIEDGLMTKDTYADWCVPPESPRLIHSQDPARKTNGTLLGTAYYYKMLRLMHRYATLLGKNEDVAEYDELASTMKSAFLARFFKADLNQFDNGTQTSAILPLAFEMEPDGTREAVFDHLVSKIHDESHDHVGVGLIGAQWLMRTLSENGRADLAYKIATQTTYPGWGYMIEKGATTIWELWNGDTADPAMNSGNHVMQIGDLGVWLYEYVAGIRPDPEHPGFKHAILRPYPIEDLTFVKASHRSMYGTIRSNWKRENGRFVFDISVPANTTATVFVPAKDGAEVTESGQAADAAKGVKLVRNENGMAVYDVESGDYSFGSRF
jgi:alpha-L-rhamnosidase